MQMDAVRCGFVADTVPLFCLGGRVHLAVGFQKNPERVTPRFVSLAE